MTGSGAGTPGYALISVLWMVTGASALGFAMSATVGEAVASSRNRVALTRHRWIAEGCLAKAAFTVSEAMVRERQRWIRKDVIAWSSVDRVLGNTDLGGACRLRARAAGSRLNVNAVDLATLRMLLTRLSGSDARADSLSQAFTDWTDSDDDPSPLGAEADWYVAQNRAPPRNGPIVHLREIRLIRGFTEITGLEDVFSVESAPVSINHAPRIVLETLPGMTTRVLDRLFLQRERGQPVRGFDQLPIGLGPEATDAVARAIPKLMSTATVEPDAWQITIDTRSEHSPVTYRLVAELVRAGTVAYVRSRRVELP